MHINSINNSYNNQNFKGQFVKTKTLDKVIEHSSLTNLNRFCKYLENMTSKKDNLKFSIKENITKSQTPDYIKRNLVFEIKKPEYFYNKYTISDEWPRDEVASNFDYAVALSHINKALEKYYPGSARKTDNFNKEQAIRRINFLLDT